MLKQRMVSMLKNCLSLQQCFNLVLALFFFHWHCSLLIVISDVQYCYNTVDGCTKIGIKGF